MVGLDAVGKTQLIYKLKYGETVPTFPSHNMDMETITVHDTITDITANFNITVLPGNYVQRGLTLLYFQQLIQQWKLLPVALIFVVDSVRPDTLENAKYAMWRICETYEALAREEQEKKENGQAGSLVLLVFANKQDVDGALSIPDIKDSLGLEERASVNMRWHIRGTETCLGSGIRDGLFWLDSQLSASSSATTTSSDGHVYDVDDKGIN